MLITSIEEQKKNKSRCSVFIDGAFALGISKEDALFYNLIEGKTIDEEKLDFIKDEVLLTEAKNKAMRFLSYSAKTEKEMLIKLKSYDFDEEIIQKVMDFLAEYSYIDDEGYAVKFTRQRFNSGYGKERVKSELFRKGIEREYINNAFDLVEYDYLETILKLIERKIKSETIEEFNKKERQKIYNFLGGRGFRYDEAKEAIALYWESENL